MAITCAAGRRVWIPLCGVAVLTLAGCEAMPVWMPFRPPVSDQVEGVTPPYERIEQLRELAADADDHSPDEREAIAKQLAQSIGKEKDSLIRAELIRTLLSYPGPTADAVLKAGLSDPEVEVRIAACDYWGSRNNEQSVVLLRETLYGDIDVDVRLAAIKALGATRQPAAADALGEALEDADPAVQYRAALAMEEITGKDLGQNVNRWRQYVKGELPEPQPTLAERLRRLF